MLQIIIPAAGAGTRFKYSNYTNPKPLIEWDGKNMIEHVVENFQNESNKIFIISRKNHHIKIDDCFIKEIDFTTEGPAISASLIEDQINMDEELIITNCDQIIKDWDQNKFLNFVSEYDGVIGCFISNKSHNSYVKVDENNLVVEVKEKEIISQIATNGLHYWKKAKYFFESLKDMKMNNDRTNGEFYVAPTYNYLINKKYKIGIFFFNQHFPIGTPEQLTNFLKNENK